MQRRQPDVMHPFFAIRPHFCSTRSDVLRALSLEALIAAILSNLIASDGYVLTAEDHARLAIASTRLLNGVAAGLDEEGQRIRRTLIKARRQRSQSRDRRLLRIT